MNDKHQEFVATPLKLIRKYDRPGPRYTSYPTVPEWTDDVGPAQYIAALQTASSKAEQPVSIYVHLPFCEKRCYFCACNVFIPRRQDHVTEYLKALLQEINRTADLLGKRNKVIQLHFGGGTPTYLTIAQFAQVLDTIVTKFELLDNAEISIEIDPRTTKEEYLKFLKERKFNRISMGVQDLDDEVQKKIGRIQPYQVTKKCIDSCRALGLSNINLDLIYGLPKQTVESFRKTIINTIGLRPDRLAVYSFAYLPKLKLHQRRINPEQLPDPHEKFRLSQIAFELFVKNGYHYIGMDHYATPEDEMSVAQSEGRLSRNFMGYTIHKAPDLIGLGISAIGCVNKTFVQNSSDFEQYVEAAGAGKFTTVRGMMLSQDDLIREHTITSIMCNFVLHKNDFKRHFQLEFDDYFAGELTELNTFIDDNLLTNDCEKLQVTKLGRSFVRNISMVFDAYLKKAESSRPLTFPRTI